MTGLMVAGTLSWWWLSPALQSALSWLWRLSKMAAGAPNLVFTEQGEDEEGEEGPAVSQGPASEFGHSYVHLTGQR